MAKIIVIGSTNTDMVVRSARIPVPGETADPVRQVFSGVLLFEGHDHIGCQAQL